jgi:hypothetical protein
VLPVSVCRGRARNPRLFQTGIERTTGYASHQYDVSSDGQRFLINAAETTASPLTVVVNWPASIRR